MGGSQEVLDRVRAHLASEGELGEWVFGIELNLQGKNPASAECLKTLRCLLDCGVSGSEASKRVSQYFGVAKNEVYSRALELSGKKA